MSYSLAGKRCLVTGGSRGIGLAIAQRFASEGAVLTLVGRNTDTLAEALATLPPSSSLSSSSSTTTFSLKTPNHSFLDFDVSSSSSWIRAVRKQQQPDSASSPSPSSSSSTEKPQIPYGYDILVNAAGISQNSLLSSTRPEDVEKLLDINLQGTIFGCQAVVPRMMKRRSGVIINVSSLLGTKGGRGASVYAASKAGIIGLTRSLSGELGRFGIRVNVLVPGYIETEMTKGMDKNNQISDGIPLGRLGSVEEVADAAAFLAKNTYAHNCVLNIDGGLSGV